MGMMLALIEVSKRALEFLPNVELVTLLFMVFTLNFGLEVLAVSVAFTLVETAFWGVNNWVIMYLYIWPAEILFVYFTRRYASYWFHAVFSALFGFCFGALCSIPYLAVGGWSMAFTWWVAGIPYDILHGVSNFVLCLILYRPLMAATKLSARRRAEIAQSREKRPCSCASGCHSIARGADLRGMGRNIFCEKCGNI